jgi:hypothetical protein
MKARVLGAAAVLFCLSIGVSPVFAGPFHTKIIGPSDSPLVLTVAENVFLQIRNFTQEGGSARGTVNVAINGVPANILTASQINSTSLLLAPEVINRVVIAGPATVTVSPVAGATLTITYRKLREGAPLLSPTPTPTATATATPTATPTPTP